MPGRTIAQIYFYTISAASIALMVVGIFSVVTVILNFTQYDKYPLRYSFVDCETQYPYGKPYAAPIDGPFPASPSAAEMEKGRQSCLNQQELDRKQHKLEDIRNAIVFTLVGILLFAIHFPQAKKFSKEK